MQIILMRHADAGEADPDRWPDDRRRPLTDAGRAEHRRTAAALRQMGIRFDRILTSPLVRARETAEITADIYGGGAPIESEEALGDRGTVAAIMGALARTMAAAVLCVGHELLLSRVAARLIGADDRARIRLEKSGIIVVDCDGAPGDGRGVLCLHLRPRELAGWLPGPPTAAG